MIKTAILAALEAIECDEWGFVSKLSLQKRTNAMSQLLQVLNKLEETNIDLACWERGCACCDTRVDTDYVLIQGVKVER